ncbi:MAG: Essential protein Yae1, N terminal [Geoglossum umbratile]|nr:MAG: Essential protein Yae1, N terminal [Geoglossum umbratile]
MKLRHSGDEGAMAALASSEALVGDPYLLESNMASPATANSQLLNDVFSNSPPPSPTNTSGPRPRSAPPSDLPRLRVQHYNAGYLNGVTLSKPTHLQRGFDSGYPLGASLGLRIGYILGVLAGLREFQLLKTATEELGLKSVLGEAADGWGKRSEAEEREGEELVERWVERVVRIAREVQVDLRVMDGEEEGGDEIDKRDDIPS